MHKKEPALALCASTGKVFQATVYSQNKTFLIFSCRPLATYETATARTFYKGRTETLRACTVAATELAMHMVSNPEDYKVGLPKNKLAS